MTFNTVLIGSHALCKHIGKDNMYRSIKDKDYLTLLNKKDFDERVDIIDGKNILDQYSFQENVATLDELYTLKVSHSPWVVTESSWYKHLGDIHHMKRFGAIIIPELYSVCYREWENRKGAKKVNLNQDKEEFFNNNVRRIYDHDSVHASIAFYEKPLFEKILSPGSDVKTSQELFEKLSHEEKKQLVHEEVMVLSIERDLLYMNDVDKAKIFKSYSHQLMLLITKYSKGWFPQWIIENYFEVNTPPFNYWKKFNESDKKILL